MFYGSIDIARSMMGIPYDTGKLRPAEFWALDDVSFELSKGETLGIIGVNGSGKSTLLRLINGIFPPDKGRITFKGRIGALIAVGAGFHPHMTGKENIYLNGTILGMTRNEIDKKLDEIIDFAEIGEFIDAPVNVYSSGMTVRLGFSIAIQSNPDILLLDEILAVGDVGFQLKCFNKIGELKSNQTASILITHNLHQISTFCNKLIVMDKGKVIHNGHVPAGLAIYKHEITSLKSEGEIEKVTTGTHEFIVTKVEFQPPLKNEKIDAQTGTNISFNIEYEALRDFRNVEIDIVIRLPIPSPNDYFQANNHTNEDELHIKKGKGTLSGTVRNINLCNITAYLFIAVWEENRKSILLWWRNIPLEIKGDILSQGWGYYHFTCSNKQ
jgi:ABC-type polysaccharide/polyol phosphate transport system ATPase subunit